jgi:hypothetical protein
METTIVLITMDMAITIMIIKNISISMVKNVMDTNMSTKSISIRTKTTSMNINMKITITITVTVKTTNSKMKSTLIHQKKLHMITNIIMKSAKEVMIINTLPNPMKKNLIKKKKKN